MNEAPGKGLCLATARRVLDARHGKANASSKGGKRTICQIPDVEGESSRMSDTHWDVVIIGGGPAGLAGALWLARYRRSVLVVDDDRPRNEAASAVHGFPGIPDMDPTALRHRIREQAAEAGAEFQLRRVTSIQGTKDAFTVHDHGGDVLRARRILLAYGRQGDDEEQPRRPRGP